MISICNEIILEAGLWPNSHPSHKIHDYFIRFVQLQQLKTMYYTPPPRHPSDGKPKGVYLKLLSPLLTSANRILST